MNVKCKNNKTQDKSVTKGRIVVVTCRQKSVGPECKEAVEVECRGNMKNTIKLGHTHTHKKRITAANERILNFKLLKLNKLRRQRRLKNPKRAYCLTKNFETNTRTVNGALAPYLGRVDLVPSRLWCT